MRQAVFVVLHALNDKKEEVSTLRSQERFSTTRISNEIHTLRNELGVEIKMDRVYYDPLNKRKHYGKYTLVQSQKNLMKVNEILKTHSTKNPPKTADR